MSCNENHITTERLLLRPFAPGDADAVMAIAGDWHVACMTADLKHPMSAAAAKLWLQAAPGEVRFAIQLGSEVIGSIGYYIDAAPDLDGGDLDAGGPDAGGYEPISFEPGNAKAVSAELGFFLARRTWGRGYALEAARAVIGHGLARHRNIEFTSSHFIDNAPCARVLSDLGFCHSHRSTIWCNTRARDLDCICYQFDRSAADHLDFSPAEPDHEDAIDHKGAAGTTPARQAMRGQQ